MDADQAKRNPLSHEQWRRRREQIRRIDFDRIAAEVNRQRLRNLNRKLQDPLEAKRIKRDRLRKLQLPLGSLPTDLKADAGRMRRTLLALHSIIGRNRSFCVRVSRIGEEMGTSAETAERGVRDLRECHLVDVKARVGDRQEDGSRRRRDRVGGRGPSEFRILWASILDEASSSGALQSLFPQDEELPVAGGAGGPDEPSGRAREGCERHPHREGSHPHREGSHPHREGSHPHREGSHPHGEGFASRRARANPFSQPSSMSPSPRGRTAASEEEEAGWTDLRARLAAYGVGRARAAIRDARDNGWTWEQISELLDRCERQTLVDTDGTTIQAHPPGRVYTQLVSFEPGTMIALSPTPRFVEAQRARTQRSSPKAEPAEAQIDRGQELDRVDARAAMVEALNQNDLADLCGRIWHAGTRRVAQQDLAEGRDPRERRQTRLMLSVLIAQEAPR